VNFPLPSDNIIRLTTTMAFSGIIDRTSPITLARLLERIYDADEPGELRLVNDATNEAARLVISRGEVVSSQCGELVGEAALRHLNSTFPWSYHFAGRSAKASDGSGAETSPRSMPVVAKRPAVKLKPLIASDERPAFHSMGAAEVPSGTATPQAFVALPTASLSAWLVGGDDHFIRLAESAGVCQGAVDSEDWEYFRADYQWLTTVAQAIGQSMGFSTPITLAVAEPQRAAAYGRLEHGFAGILGGKGAGVAQVLQFDTFTAIIP
jgi:hypothetical protein